MSTQYDYSDVWKVSSGQYSPRRWSAKHDVIHELVPFEHFTTNPWDQLETVRDYLRSEPEHSSTWRWQELDELDACPNYRPRRRLFRDILGAWAYRTKGNAWSVFVNPYYSQLDAVEWTPDDHRMHHILRNGLLAKWTLSELADRYNLAINNMGTWIGRRGFEWDKIRAYGRVRIANTAKLAYYWTDRTRGEVAELLGISERTIHTWVSRHGTLDPVPQRPSESGIGSGW
jgi:hypothetical protein